MQANCCSLDGSDFPSLDSRLELVETLVETSHYSVRITGCRECGAQFLKVFAEQVDLLIGEDPMEWVIVRLSPKSEKKLRKLGPAFDPTTVMSSISGDSWKKSFPAGGEISYSKGSSHPFIMLPD